MLPSIMTSVSRLTTLAEDEHPILIVGSERRKLLAIAREIHARSSKCRGPFVIHRCGLPFWRRPTESGELTRLCARIFRQSSGGTLYFEGVNQLSVEEHHQLYMALERKEFWDPESGILRPVDYRIVASAPAEILKLNNATNLVYRLAEIVISLD